MTQQTVTPGDVSKAPTSELLFIQKLLQEVKDKGFGELRIQVKNGYVFSINKGESYQPPWDGSR